MNSIARRIWERVRVSLFPTKVDLGAREWSAIDGSDERLRYEFPLHKDAVIVDLGGYKGQWTSDIFSRYCCNVHVFEPVGKFAAAIRERFHLNPKIKVHEVALGHSPRMELITLCADGSSVLREGSEKEEIEFVDAIKYFADHSIVTIDLAKVNIEGGEYELFPVLLDSGFIKNIRYLLIQFHYLNSESDDEMVAICKRLESTHRLKFRFNYVWECWELKPDQDAERATNHSKTVQQ